MTARTPADDRPQSRSAQTRRALLYVTMTSLGVGACSLAWWMRSQSSTRVRSNDSAPPRGSLPWAEALVDADDAALLLAAGDLERLSLRETRHAELFTVLFHRLFLAAMLDPTERADPAAACALRGLERLDRLDLIGSKVGTMRGRADLREANALWLRFSDRGGRRR